MTSLRERHDELQESFTTELRNDMDSVGRRIDIGRSRACLDTERIARRSSRKQRDSRKTRPCPARAEESRDAECGDGENASERCGVFLACDLIAQADYQEKVNTLSTNNSKFVTEQMTELEVNTETSESSIIYLRNGRQIILPNRAAL